MPGIGPMEVVVLCVIALLVLGPKRLPEAGRSLGRGIREFRDGVKELGPGARHDAARESPEREPADVV
jgi:sec-independent protein translocase protein TatA